MPALLLVSGVLSASLRGKPLSVTLSRVAGLIWLFCLWTPIVLLAHQTHDLTANKIVNDLLLPRSETWFLWTLALLTAFTVLLRWLPTGPFLALALISSVATHYHNFNVGPFAVQQTLRYGFYFYLGWYYSTALVSQLQQARPWHGLALAGIYVIAHLTDAFILRRFGVEVLSPVQALGITGAVVAGLHIFRGNALVLGLEWFGRRTVAIYLAHMPLMIVVGGTLHLTVGLVSTTNVVLAAAGTSAAALLLHMLAVRIGFNWLYTRPSFRVPSLPRFDRVASEVPSQGCHVAEFDSPAHGRV